MKGDANPVEDPAPYTVSSVRTVLWSAPGLARWVAAASSPFVLGGVTLAVAGLVTWALWPRNEQDPPIEEPADV
jgi:signal peptidase